MFAINLISFIVQNLIIAYAWGDGSLKFEDVAMCPVNVIGKNQWYRLVTSEITHGGFTHIASNMIIFLVWGPVLERHFGTILYAILNVFIGFISNLMTLGIQYGLSDYAPEFSDPAKSKP